MDGYFDLYKMSFKGWACRKMTKAKVLYKKNLELWKVSTNVHCEASLDFGLGFCPPLLTSN